MDAVAQVARGSSMDEDGGWEGFASKTRGALLFPTRIAKYVAQIFLSCLFLDGCSNVQQRSKFAVMSYLFLASGPCDRLNTSAFNPHINATKAPLCSSREIDRSQFSRDARNSDATRKMEKQRRGSECFIVQVRFERVN